MDMNYRGNVGGRGWAGWSGVRGGGIWDNCNSIINKYIFLKEEKKKDVSSLDVPVIQM